MKKFFPVFLLLTAALPAQTVDFGLITENLSTLYTDAEVNLSQKNTQKPWMNLLFPGFEVRFSGHFSTVYSTGTETLALEPDVDMLSLRWTLGIPSDALSKIDFQFGRFKFSDSLGYVLSSTLDGLSLQLGGAGWNTTLGGGFNGLRAKASTGILLTTSDLTDQQNEDIFFGSPRFIGLLEQKFVLTPQHTGLLTYLPQLDLRKWFTPSDRTLKQEGDGTFATSESGLLNTHHILLGMEGTFFPGFYYKAQGGFLTGQSLYYNDEDQQYKNALITGTSGILALDWFLMDALSSVVHLQGLWTSGDPINRMGIFAEGAKFAQDPGTIRLFRSLSGESLGFVFTPLMGNTSTIEASYTVKLLQEGRSSAGLNLGLTTRTFFRTATGPMSSQRVLMGDGVPYLGTEGVLTARYRPTSELSLLLTTGLFIPYEGDKSLINPLQSGIDTRTALYLGLSL